ncbi:MAG: T9SS type A sorting domain-containing protein [Bacteroidetes bacterium]|nr:T9SS type A sorting domain-containing protein [Bacteroidota bacterium]
MKKSLLFLSVLVIATLGFAQTTVPNIITSSQVWTPAGSPYLVNQNTYIGTGISIKVMPGTVIKGPSTAVKLQVDGELQLLGKADTAIVVKRVNLQYNTSSKDYNPITKAGNSVLYTNFDSIGSGAYGISVAGASVYVSHCRFSGGFYGVSFSSSSGDTNTAEVNNCIFEKSMDRSIEMRDYGKRCTFIIRHCEFYESRGGLYIYGDLIFEGNIVKNQQGFSMYVFRYAEIKCNLFKNCYSVDISMNTVYDTMRWLNFKNNTLDSLGYFNYPMFKIMDYNYNNIPAVKVTINENNFLYYKGNAVKVELYIPSQNVPKFKLMNLQKNYWGTTDTNQIKAYIKDWADNINMYALADYSNYLSARDTGCSIKPDKGCKSDFIIAVDSTDNNSFYLIENSKKTSMSTIFDWTFNGISIKNTRLPNFKYYGSGKIWVCLHIYDPKTNCNSTFCDSVGPDGSVDSGYFIQAIDWGQLNGVRNPGKEKAVVKLFPNPADQMATVELNSVLQQSPVLRIYNAVGVSVLTRTYQGRYGTLPVDISKFSSGVYTVVVSNTNGRAATRLIVGK